MYNRTCTEETPSLFTESPTAKCRVHFALSRTSCLLTVILWYH